MPSAPALFLFGLTTLGARADLPAPVLATAAAQDDAGDKRPEVAELIAKLDAHASKRGAEDNEAVAVVDQLLAQFETSGPKDKAAIVKGLSKCFEEPRKVAEGEPPNNKLFLAAATALGRMGPESTKTLMQWIGHKDHRKDTTLQHKLLLSLGKTKDKAALKPLMMNLDNKTPALISAAAEGLAEFADAEEEVRKEAFEALLKTLMSAKGQMDLQTEDTIARERYDTIAAPIITSLGRLARHDERDPAEWQRWWNKNKKTAWDGAK